MSKLAPLRRQNLCCLLASLPPNVVVPRRTTSSLQMAANPNGSPLLCECGCRPSDLAEEDGGEKTSATLSIERSAAPSPEEQITCSEMFPFILPLFWLPPSLPSSPPTATPHPSLPVNELPSDYWGFWRSIRTMCEGLEAADGSPSSSSSPASLPSQHTRCPRASGGEKLSASSKASTYWLFAGFYFSTEYISSRGGESTASLKLDCTVV